MNMLFILSFTSKIPLARKLNSIIMNFIHSMTSHVAIVETYALAELNTAQSKPENVNIRYFSLFSLESFQIFLAIFLIQSKPLDLLP